MSYVEWSKAWVVCDGPDCDNEFIWSKAPLYGWTSTGAGEHLCPNHSADAAAPGHVVDVKVLAAGER